MLLERAEKGLPTPALDRRPTLENGLGFYFTAYNDLKYDRPIGMTLGPIPWSSVVKWGEIHGITDPDDLDVLNHHIRAMENAVYALEERRKAKSKGKK